MGCGCGKGNSRVTVYEVRDGQGNLIGEYPTRGEATTERAKAGAGATMKPKVKQT